MALNINWTPKAKETFLVIISFLESNWSEKEVSKFVSATDRIIGLISLFPNLFSQSGKKKNVHRAVISKQTSLFYRVKKGEIELITFWDNRRNPKSLKI